MHLLPTQSRSLDEAADAVEPDQSPADILLLSFTDADLAVAAAAWEQDRARLPSLRLVNLGRLRHPFSVDLFVERLASRARVILVRLLGGADYWRYGVDELAILARRTNIPLALLPGDDRADERLADASTLDAADLAQLAGYFQAGGAGNLKQALRFAANRIGADMPIRPPRPVPAAGLYRPGCRPGEVGAPHVAILFYRSALMAADTAPILALASALAARGARVTSFFVASLKDGATNAILGRWLDEGQPDAVITTTAFAVGEAASRVLDRADVPVLQAILAGSDQAAWAASPRGLRAADLAMNVVLPELDGRLAAGVLSFKSESAPRPDLEFTRIVHRPNPNGVAHVADLALAWAALRHTSRHERRLACILPDYPGKAGRAGYAVGLDTPRSVVMVADALRTGGFDVGQLPDAAELMETLASISPEPLMRLELYRRLFENLPSDMQASVRAAWGEPDSDPDCVEGGFRMRHLVAGKLVVAVQPDRGSPGNRHADYHDPALPPRHGYIAFYLWLRQVFGCHAAIHLGTHGSLEWLPGKAVALSDACHPAALTGALPMIYPFIVNNPGEAAQAKRRIGAVTIGHLTPPLVEAGRHGDTADLERMFDEYAEAATLDPRRAKLLASAILDHAEARGLWPSGTDRAATDDALAHLDAWLCDLKEMRIGDGLHVFGQSPTSPSTPLTDACGPAEMAGLLAALDGRFVQPGPSGAPGRGRLDVLPTGRNLYSIDPRAIPTRTAWEIGSRLAEDLVTRHAQDEGAWPRRVVLDLWGSATMRTGGDDLAQAFALIGTRPTWDPASTRVTGFDIRPLAVLGRSRVDVTLRISGLFRDTFPDQITLFDAAVRAVAGLDESDDDNPLAEARRAGREESRVFGAAPGAYGIGLARRIVADRATSRAALGEAYLDATSHSFGPQGDMRPNGAAFRTQVASAEAFSHAADQPGQDALDSDTFAEHEGGFAAAAALLGAKPRLYRADTSQPDRPRLRTLAEDIDRAMHGRAGNPRWIAGQMRHGHRGAIALAETLDALFAFAATTELVPSRHFDTYFDATLGNDAVRDFLVRANPAAARAMAEAFAAAARLGHWTSRRNSTEGILAGLLGEPADVVS